MKSPIEALFVIADISQQKRILKFLTDNEMFGKVIMSGNGTAESAIGDIFGFGIVEKNIIVSFVNTERSFEVCSKINDIINKKEYNGIVFTVPIDAISSDLFKLVGGSVSYDKK